MTADPHAGFALPKAGLVIGEKFLEAGSGGTHVHVFPATGEEQAAVPLAGASEVEAAVAAAKQALAGWRATKPSVRRDMLFRLADLVEAHG